MILVSDLRQYTYCPRIVYYRTVLPAIRPTTYMMEAGKEAHRDESDRERRRSLRTYRVPDGTRAFDIWLEDEALGLRGKLDMAILRAEEAIPVEYKHSPGRLGHHVVMQLAAYGMLLEQAHGVPVTRGFVYFIPARRAREIALMPELKGEVRQLSDAIAEMVAGERMPGPPVQRSRCEACEFRRFCNDVV